ncbi:hypothetical protein JWG44_00335 [Leptospira sp. 201903071]|uniref:hypothetical protein n=1 Tax=Leptospira ainazelensis TaxID=2810034 RepID=UPI001962E240|nr:hypothetical protein [Leptospira ainazelensis]MBM9498701.1 hypothetical protein [Leptospira ainazelensis]
MGASLFNLFLRPQNSWIQVFLFVFVMSCSVFTESDLKKCKNGVGEEWNRRSDVRLFCGVMPVEQISSAWATSSKVIPERDYNIILLSCFIALDRLSECDKESDFFNIELNPPTQ